MIASDIGTEVLTFFIESVFVEIFIESAYLLTLIRNVIQVIQVKMENKTVK